MGINRADQLNVSLDHRLKTEWRNWARLRGTTITELIEGLARHCLLGESLIIPGELAIEREDLKKLVRAEVRAEVQSAIAVQSDELYQLLAEQAKQAQGTRTDLKHESNISEKIHELGENLDPETAATIAVEDGLSHGEISEIYSKTGSTVRTWANPKGGGKPRTTPDKKYTYNPEKRLWFSTQIEEKSNAQ